MVKKQTTGDGEILPDFGVYNDDEKYYKQYRSD
jgi:hypothetical protein